MDIKATKPNTIWEILEHDQGARNVVWGVFEKAIDKMNTTADIWEANKLFIWIVNAAEGLRLDVPAGMRSDTVYENIRIALKCV